MIRQYIALAVVLAIIGAGLGGEWHGRKTERTKWEARIQTERADASETARKAERAQQEKVNDALRKQNESLAGVNAGLQSDLERLRKRPKRPARVPESPRPSCEGATGAELSRDDASFLVREAARADRLRAALSACYAAYDAITEGGK